MASATPRCFGSFEFYEPLSQTPPEVPSPAVVTRVHEGRLLQLSSLLRDLFQQVQPMAGGRQTVISARSVSQHAPGRAFRLQWQSITAVCKSQLG